MYEKYGAVFQDAPDRLDESASLRWGRAYDWYLRGWLPASKGARIVDLACGYGRLLHFFHVRDYQNVAGLDISPDQVCRARKVVPDVFEGDVIEFLELHTDEYDLVSAIDLIEHLSKEEALRFLHACHSALRRGGRLVLQTPNADSPFGMAIRYNDLSHEICFNPNALSRLLALHWFRDIETREVGPVPWGYSSASTVRWLAWQVVRAGLAAWNLVETGSTGNRILTRNFLISGMKSDS